MKRDATHVVRHERRGIPAITVVHDHERYRLTLRVCADDHADVVRIEAHLEDRRPAADRAAGGLRLYPLLAPHLGFSGNDGRAWSADYKGQPMLFARRDEWSLALASDPAPVRQAVGYVGTSDGWQDFQANGRMDWTYSEAAGGNVAAMSELVLDSGLAQIALAFGSRPEEAALEARAALATRFEAAWAEYIGNWRGFVRTVVTPPASLSREQRDLFMTSAVVLRAAQDRTEPGATVASLSIPWGNTRNDVGGYHLVWSRDLVESAGAFVALGATATARRTLAYLAASQEADGHWAQNQWVDGVPYWKGIQLDEAAYPLLLAGAVRSGATHMHGRGGTHADAFRSLLTERSLDGMIARAAGFIARTGPATGQDRWEENAGLTPSSLAPVVAALVVAAEHLPEPSARTAWSLPTTGTRRSRTGRTRWTRSRARARRDGHYVRIASPDVLAGAPIATPVPVRNRPPGMTVPADAMVGTDFLALVRFGLRLPDDPRIVSSLAVADALLRTDTPSGPVWHRYNGDGYGEHADGAAFDGTGIGRGWPLLGGERGHYELAAGRDPLPYLEAMRRWRRAAACCPSRCGTRTRSPRATWCPAGPAVRRCRWRGPTRNTSSWSGSLRSAIRSIGPTRRGVGMAGGLRFLPGTPGGSRHSARRWRPAAP